MDHLIPKPKKPPTPKKPEYKSLPADPDLQYPIPKPEKPPIPKEPAYKNIPAGLDPDDPQRRELIGYNQKVTAEYKLQIKKNHDIYKQELEKWERDEARFVYKQKLAWEREMHNVYDYNQKLEAEYKAQLKLRDENHKKAIKDWEKKICGKQEENSKKITEILM